jgi:hypothetical protein
MTKTNERAPSTTEPVQTQLSGAADALTDGLACDRAGRVPLPSVDLAAGCERAPIAQSAERLHGKEKV